MGFLLSTVLLALSIMPPDPTYREGYGLLRQWKNDDESGDAPANKKLAASLIAALGVASVSEQYPCKSFLLFGIWDPDRPQYSLQGYYVLSNWASGMPMYELQWDIWGQAQSVDNGERARYFLHFDQASQAWLVSKQLAKAAIVVMKLHSTELTSMAGGAIWQGIRSPLPEAQSLCVNATLVRPLSDLAENTPGRVLQTGLEFKENAAMVKRKYNMSQRLFQQWRKETMDVEKHFAVSPSQVHALSVITGERMVSALSEAKDARTLQPPCPAYFVSGVWKPGYGSRLMGYYVLNDWSADQIPTYQLRWDLWGQARPPKHRRRRSREYYLRPHKPSKSWCITSGFSELTVQRLEMLQIPVQADAIFGKSTAANATNTRWLSYQNGMLEDVTAVCETNALIDPFPLEIPTPAPTGVYSSIPTHLLARIGLLQKRKLPGWELKSKVVDETNVHHLNQLHLSQILREDETTKTFLESATWEARRDFHNPCPSFLLYQTNSHMHKLKMTHTTLQRHLANLMGYYVFEFWDSKRTLPVYRLQRDTWGQQRRTSLGSADYYLYFEPSRSAWCIGVAGFETDTSNSTKPNKWLLTAFGSDFTPAFHGYDSAAGPKRKINGLSAELMLVDQNEFQWLAAGEVVLTMDAFCNKHVIRKEPTLATARLMAPELQIGKQAPSSTRAPTDSVSPALWRQFQDRTDSLDALNKLEEEVRDPSVHASNNAALAEANPLNNLLALPTFAPTLQPSSPTARPTPKPTTVTPTAWPTTRQNPDALFEVFHMKRFHLEATSIPSASPTNSPTSLPTGIPSSTTTSSPSYTPTRYPTNPTLIPTPSPSVESRDEIAMGKELQVILSSQNKKDKWYSIAPTSMPSTAPTNATASPTVAPTASPTVKVTSVPTAAPTSLAPSVIPTAAPTSVPTGQFATYEDLQEAQELADAIRKARLARSSNGAEGGR
jgi:hypothetical protein